nr:polysaccharide deacetylase family protein [Agromyces seonyuensis]
MVVRLGDLENGAAVRNSGSFADLALYGGRIPSVLARALALFCVDTDEHLVAVTYDDGPGADTPRLLDRLAERGAVATFFVLAEQAEQHPELVRRIVDEGHELALHGVDHRSLREYGPWAGVRKVREARRRVERIAGIRVRRYRPPFGEYTTAQALGLRLSGLDVVIWSADAVDWRDDDGDAVADRAIAALHPGAILLLHDHRGDPETLRPDEALPAFDRVAVLDRLLDAATAAGYGTATVGGLSERHSNVRSLARFSRAD